MRKILAIVLLLVFGLPSALPLLAAGQDDAGLPACCRRAGKHHCAMSAEDAAKVLAGAADGDAKRGVKQMRAAGEACPYRCAMLTQTHVQQDLGTAASLRWYAGIVSHPAVQAQTESRWRVARERSRGKRGPPRSS
ncbi:hypothetical protein [Terriglobus aquaticus]|uniref:Uncharacterized protein n=1 Tax=Terriglobus aquaticus TaxID=940139 RepID=A0ABW9KM81_9BACT|nr:hypothetical protein [Terriglobus aquaticus]